MQTPGKKVVWSKRSQRQLLAAYESIHIQSPKNAEKVRSDLITMTRRLPQHPEIYTLDKTKLKTTGATGLLRSIVTGLLTGYKKIP